MHENLPKILTVKKGITKITYKTKVDKYAS